MMKKERNIGDIEVDIEVTSEQSVYVYVEEYVKLGFGAKQICIHINRISVSHERMLSPSCCCLLRYK